MTETDISRYLSLPYTKVLKRDDEGHVIATIAELDGCMAHGDNDEEALRNLQNAQAAWIEAALDAGQDVPVPEMEEDLPSGRFVLRLPRHLHHRANKLAKKDDVSLNQFIVTVVAEHIGHREGRKAAVKEMQAAWRAPAAKWEGQIEHKTGVGKSALLMERLKAGGTRRAVEEREWPKELVGRKA